MNAECIMIRVTDENGLTVSTPSPKPSSTCRRFVSPPPPRERAAADFFLHGKNSQPLQTQTNRPSAVANL